MSNTDKNASEEVDLGVLFNAIEFFSIIIFYNFCISQELFTYYLFFKNCY